MTINDDGARIAFRVDKRLYEANEIQGRQVNARQESESESETEGRR